MRPGANCHVHLPPNFSSLPSAASAARRAKEEGIAILGASNYYDHRVYEPFRLACEAQGVTPLYGIEILCRHEPSAMAGHRINDPENPGRFYLCGKALKRLADPSPRAVELLAAIRERDRARMDEMAERLEGHLAACGVDVAVDPRAIEAETASAAGVPSDWAVLQERHLAAWVVEQITESPSGDRAEILSRVYGGPAKETRRSSGIQKELRSRLLKAGKPAFVPEACIDVKDAIDLIHELDGIVSYPVVFDGMEPRSEFEESPAILAARLKELGIEWIEFIPSRNRLALLPAVELASLGFHVTAGTEHNTPDDMPLRPACLGGDPLSPDAEEAFYQGALGLVEHQHGASARASLEDAHV